MNVNASSRLFTRAWHAQLATKYQVIGGNGELWNGMTLCEYSWRVLWGIFWAVILTIGMGIVAAAVADFCAWIAAGVLNGFVSPDELAGAMIILIAPAAVIVLACYIGWRLHERSSRRYGVREPTMFERLWEQHRDKVCFRLTFDKKETANVQE